MLQEARAMKASVRLSLTPGLPSKLQLKLLLLTAFALPESKALVERWEKATTTLALHGFLMESKPREEVRGDRRCQTTERQDHNSVPSGLTRKYTVK